ncbi:MAG: hypothetical protein HZB82_09555 [Deltaproteobacteria bacterium]|nr:hypothetical protein [Deltaproteobacteria bacterium]
MDLSHLFYWANQWLVIGGVLGLLFIASEAGWRVEMYDAGLDIPRVYAAASRSESLHGACGF